LSQIFDHPDVKNFLEDKTGEQEEADSEERERTDRLLGAAS